MLSSLLRHPITKSALITLLALYAVKILAGFVGGSWYSLPLETGAYSSGFAVIQATVIVVAFVGSLAYFTVERFFAEKTVVPKGPDYRSAAGQKERVG